VVDAQELGRLIHREEGLPIPPVAGPAVSACGEGPGSGVAAMARRARSRNASIVTPRAAMRRGSEPCPEAASPSTRWALRVRRLPSRRASSPDAWMIGWMSGPHIRRPRLPPGAGAATSPSVMPRSRNTLAPDVGPDRNTARRM
jgi:hypothetical protein